MVNLKWREENTLNTLEAIVKKAEKKGLWAAMDIGVIWLERAIKDAE